MTIGAMVPSHDGEVVEEVDQRTSLIRLAVVIGAVIALALFSWSGAVFGVFLLLTLFIHELGHYLGARRGGMKVTEFFIGFGPRIWSFRRGETEYGFKGIPLGAYVKTPGMTNLEELSEADEVRSYRAQSYRHRFVMVLAGPATNLLAGLLLFAVFFSFYREPIVEDAAWPLVGAITAETPAGQAGIRDGDRILAIDGVDVSSFDEFKAQVKPHPSESVVVSFERDGVRQNVTVTLGRRDGVNADGTPTGTSEGFLGVVPMRTIERSVPAGVGRGMVEFGRQVKGTVAAIGDIFSPSGLSRIFRMVVGQEVDDPTKRPTSIVGITKYGSSAVRSGAAETLYLLASLNMALGLFNLLPVLPLDGGHLLIASYEKLRSRRGRRYHADFAKVMPVFAVLMVALMFVFMSAIYLDTF
jgi:membrane-associated protease RseP (regulator of RpoE activity)